ncbi:S8 family serine peptidase, partial [Aeribacillus pallidus]|uniref:S8 family serine peptidase n=1 Tax=Aeribacillus pallidus TaxID=33936 RepID=UPI003D1DCDE2
MKSRIAMILIFLLTFANTAFGAQLALPEKPKRSLDERIQALTFDDEETVRVIVEVGEEPGILFAQKRGLKFEDLSDSTKESLEKEALEAQNDVKDQIDSAKIDIKYINSFTTVFNGFSAEVQYGDVEFIESIPNVKKVHIVNKYEKPKVQPQMIYSKSLVEAQQAWQSYGYKGEGMVVGIIDTGIDPSHKDMILSESTTPKLSKEQVEQIISQQNLPGQFFTEKVPYGYNYMDNNQEIRDLGSSASMHGMHVAGTVGANGDEDNGGIKGIAPEAQLLALKVFGNDPEVQFTYGDVYVKAIDDAIKLGVDVINMSLGATAGFVSEESPEQQAVKRAVDNGVLMAISAGNSAYFGNGFYYPFTSNPDIGVVGSPGVAYDSLQVASFENELMDVDALNYTIDPEGETPEEGTAAFLSASSVHPNELVQKTYEIVAANLGKEEDFEGIDVSGKFVLIQRGGIPFVEKTLNAQNNGALGVIIYNNVDGIVNMASDPNIKIPQLFMLKNDGEYLRDQLDAGKKVTVRFNGETQTINNPDAGKMSDFTSWGLTPNLDFKPEITAPGGKILSTLNNNQYGIMSGTSMAAPHVAGGAALVLSRVDEEFGASGLERVLFAKNLLMNTSYPVVDPSNGTFYSPRRQGAGLMQLHAALSTPVIVTEAHTGEAKVALKEITSDQVTFTLTAQNYGDEAVTYEVQANAQTDYPYYGLNATTVFGALNLDDVVITINGEETATIEVPANGSTTVDITIDVSAVDLSEDFPNGYFLEGFVTFIDPTDTYPTLTVPYVGFKGDWDQAPIIDPPMWLGPEYSFYEMTGVLTEVAGGYAFLGEDLETGTIDPSLIAISPNGDGLNDVAIPILSFLRNAKEVQFNVLDNERNHLRTLRTEHDVRKNYFDGGRAPEYSLEPARKWDGKVNNRVVAEGEYYLEVKAKIDYPNAEWQSLLLPVKVDLTAPELEASFDEKAQKVTVTVADEENGSGVAFWDVLVDDESVLDAPLLATDTEYQFTKSVASHEKVAVVALDYAGNMTYQVVKEAIDKEFPEIHLLTPEALAVVDTHEITFSGYVDEKSGIETISVNGQEAEVTYNPKTKQYEFSVVVKVEEDGVHDFTITGKDSEGNELSFGRKVIVDTTAPTLKVSSVPSIVGSDDPNPTISVEVKDNFDEIRLYLNDDEVFYNEFKEPFAMREFSQTIDVELPLKEGDNEFVLKVTDLAGHETTKEFTVKKGISTPPGGGVITPPAPTQPDTGSGGGSSPSDEKVTKEVNEQDIYADLQDESIEEVVVDLSYENGDKEVEVSFNTDLVKKVADKDKDLIIKTKSTTVALPQGLLNDLVKQASGQVKFIVKTEEVSKIPKADTSQKSLSKVYDFTITVNNKNVSTFAEPVKVEVKVNASDVKDKRKV